MWQPTGLSCDNYIDLSCSIALRELVENLGEYKRPAYFGRSLHGKTPVVSHLGRGANCTSTSGKDPRPKNTCLANDLKRGRRKHAQAISCNAGCRTLDISLRIQSLEANRARNKSPE